MVASILIARMLGADNFGVYGIIQSTLHIGLLVGFALGGALTKYLAEYKYKDSIKAGNILGLVRTLSLGTSAFMMILLVLSSSWLANNTLNRADLAPLLCTSAVLLFLSSMNSVQLAALAGFENFKEITRISSINAILVPVFAIPLIYNFGVHGAIVSIIIPSCISYAISVKVLKKECIKYNIISKDFHKDSFKELPLVLNFAMPALISSLFIVPSTWISNTILVNDNNGYMELGLFNAANQWRQLIAFLPQILTVVTLPILSETHGREDKKDFFQAFKINLRLTWSYALPMTIFVILFRNPIAGLFGSQFHGMTSMMVLLMITSFVNIISSVISTTMLSTGNIWIMAFFNFLWGTVLIISTSILTKSYGGFGMAVAYLLATSLLVIGQIIYAEMKIARNVFAGEHLLIFTTLISILTVSLDGYLNIGSTIVGITVFTISLIPCVRTGFKYIYNN